MRLTTEVVARFVGGQAEVQNKDRPYLYCGEIKKITVANNELVVEFAWLAKGEGFPPAPKRWVKHVNVPYNANLEIYLGVYVVDNVGPNGSEVGGRIFLSSSIVGETVTLYPPDDSKLDPAKVEGLNLVRQ